VGSGRGVSSPAEQRVWGASRAPPVGPGISPGRRRIFYIFKASNACRRKKNVTFFCQMQVLRDYWSNNCCCCPVLGGGGNCDCRPPGNASAWKSLTKSICSCNWAISRSMKLSLSSWTKDCSLWLTYKLCTENYNTGTAICFSRVVKKIKCRQLLPHGV